MADSTAFRNRCTNAALSMALSVIGSDVPLYPFIASAPARHLCQIPYRYLCYECVSLTCLVGELEFAPQTQPPQVTRLLTHTSSTNGGTTQFPIVCSHSQTFSGLAPGKWDMTGKAVRGMAPTCQKTVTAGGKTAATWVFNEGGTAESCN